jgi:hypothetical protein
MVLGTWWGWGNWPTVALAVVLAFLFGYSLTIGFVLRANVTLRQAVKVALAADTVSILVMEITNKVVAKPRQSVPTVDGEAVIFVFVGKSPPGSM